MCCAVLKSVSPPSLNYENAGHSTITTLRALCWLPFLPSPNEPIEMRAYKVDV